MPPRAADVSKKIREHLSGAPAAAHVTGTGKNLYSLPGWFTVVHSLSPRAAAAGTVQKTTGILAASGLRTAPCRMLMAWNATLKLDPSG
jgi:hypothetical protein